MIALSIAGLVGGLVIAIFASQRALRSAIALSQELGLSRFVIGMTVVAVGTDLPEIANSIVASGTGHGDLNVGDSVGSSVTQMTLVLGLLCLSGRLQGEKRFVLVAGSSTVAMLALGTVLVSDEYLSRTDGLTLVGGWTLGTLYIASKTELVQVSAMGDRAAWRTSLALLGSLAVVGGGAFVAVESFVDIADRFGLPEYITSFFVLSLGTSLPELVVDANALRRGESSLALGDLLGSSFVDATLSLGIGPTLFPASLSESAVRGGLVATGVVAVCIAMLARSEIYRRSTGVSLLLLYGLVYVSLLG
jgi:cation:H+ antiporter